MKKSDVLLLIALMACVGLAVVFGIPGIIPYADERLGRLIAETIPRLAAGGVLLILTMKLGYTQAVKAKWKASHLLWSIPCFFVAIVNFPFSALIGGAATINRIDLLWLFFLKCAAIAIFEEIFFRALLLPFFMEQMQKRRYCVIWSVLGSSLLFALMHLVNLFFGAGFGATAMQVGYTFLLGCMLAVMLLKTKNVWLCVIIHALFDIGGTIVTDLGSGPFQDTVFWILTAVAGTLCAAHIILSLRNIIRAYQR